MKQKTKNRNATPPTNEKNAPVATNAAERGAGPANASQKSTANSQQAPAKTPAQYRRKTLAALSSELKAQNPDKSTNALLLAHYAAKLGSKVFHTFEEWRERGRAIKQGEHAVTIWKRAEDKGRSGWLMEYLYAETQTTERRPAPVTEAAAVALF